VNSSVRIASLIPVTLAVTIVAGSSQADDPEYGEYLASECKTCHQISGANDGIPGISGWAQEDFVVAMHAYKRKLRPHPIMQMMAGRLSDVEIAALAAYFGDLD
jgi:cytochrome c